MLTNYMCKDPFSKESQVLRFQWSCMGELGGGTRFNPKHRPPLKSCCTLQSSADIVHRKLSACGVQSAGERASKEEGDTALDLPASFITNPRQLSLH